MTEARARAGEVPPSVRVLAPGLLSLMAQVMSDFIDAQGDQLGSAIDRTLASIGRLFDVDRAYLFELATDGLTMDNTFEWTAEGISAQKDNLCGLPVSAVPWWMARMQGGTAIILSSLDDLPAEAAAERAILEPQGVQSLLVLPLAGRDRLKGFVGFDHVRGRRQWSQEEIDVLRIVAGAIAQSLERQVLGRRLLLADTIFRHADEGIFVTDRDQRIVELNNTFTALTGYSREEAIGRTPNMLSSGRQGPEFYAAMWAALASTDCWRGEIWNRRKDGSLYLERLSISAVRGRNGELENYVGVFSDITQMKEQEERLEQMAYYDALTKLPNRALLSDRMSQALAQVRRNGSMLAVGYLDLDLFKPVNDAYGHGAGDSLLIEMSQRLKGSLRTGDTVARLGGDEFVLLMPCLSSQGECDTLLRRLLDCVAEPFEVAPGHPVTLTASIGLRMVPPDDADPDTLLRQADQALYAAKQEGRGRAHRFDPVLDRQVVLGHEHRARVTGSIGLGEMCLYFQPIVELGTGRLAQAEALVRWNRPHSGLVPPGEWLPAIEGTSAMHALGEWVLATALATCERWQSEGVDIALSINVSGVELRDPQFPERVRTALARHPGIKPSRLHFEVLESATLSDMALVSHNLAACTAFGVQFSLDDFGTGYSSLTYLKRLPVTTIKIDRSFVADMLDDAGDRAIVTGVIELARVFGRRSVAEGVETAEHAALLRQLNCDLGQGIGIAAPMPADQFVAWARSRE